MAAITDLKVTSLYPDVRDFDTVYPPSADPFAAEDLGSNSSFQEERVASLRKIYTVFDPAESADFAKAIRVSPRFEPSFSFPGGRRDFYIAPTLETYEVSFGAGGQAEVEAITSPKYTSQLPSIQKAMIKALERLGHELGWKNSTQHVACNAIDYHFSPGAEEPLVWHTDERNEEASHSCVILLSDPHDKVSGWTGGKFLYTGRREFEKSKSFDKKIQLYGLEGKTKGAVLNDPDVPIWESTPTFNDGLLFSNNGMNHKITSMQPLDREGRRLIFTVFIFPTKQW